MRGAGEKHKRQPKANRNHARLTPKRSASFRSQNHDPVAHPRAHRLLQPRGRTGRRHEILEADLPQKRSTSFRWEDGSLTSEFNGLRRAWVTQKQPKPHRKHSRLTPKRSASFRSPNNDPMAHPSAHRLPQPRGRTGRRHENLEAPFQPKVKYFFSVEK